MSKSYGHCSESQCTTTQRIQVLTQTFELILRVEISCTLWEIAVHRITEDPGPHPHFWIQAFPASINSEAWTSQSSVCVVSEEWGLRFEEDKMGKRMRREKSICCCNSPLAGFSWYLYSLQLCEFLSEISSNFMKFWIFGLNSAHLSVNLNSNFLKLWIS